MIGESIRAALHRHGFAIDWVRDGAAAEAGIRPGDVVLSANGAPTRSVADLRKVVAASKNHVALLVQRGQSRIFVPVEPG